MAQHLLHFIILTIRSFVPSTHAQESELLYTHKRKDLPATTRCRTSHHLLSVTGLIDPRPESPAVSDFHYYYYYCYYGYDDPVGGE